MPDSRTARNPEHDSIPVVAIGASAGGLEQITLLLREMPLDTGAAFVVIQHLDPNHESQLTDLIGSASQLPVVAIEDRMPLIADRVHVIPPGHSLSIDNGVLRIEPAKAREAAPTLIDRFFRDLASVRGQRAVGIVLSGTGSDGARGLKAIRTAGGLAIAQSPDTAQHDGMPRAAAKNASPDCLLDTADMVTPLCNHLRLNLANATCQTGPDTSGDDDDHGNDDSDGALISDEALKAILKTLREQDGHDFRNHKPNMLKRRILRRIRLNGTASAQDYLDTLEADGRERERLCGDFLISVTDFFREPKAYRALEHSVIRPLLKNRSVDDPIRVWVPGCATGEEAYSIAMLIAEQIEATDRNCSYLVFATDVDKTALATGRAGLYPDSIEADMSAERLRLFFDKVDDQYQVKRVLRERVVFAPQNVTDDPPYSRLDLVSCRNLLIYLKPDTQKRVITLFHFSLKERGFLFLGSAETVADQVDLFEPVAKEHRLFRRIGSSRQYKVDFPSDPAGQGEPLSEPDAPRRYSRGSRDVEEVARDILLQEHVPASVLVNRKLEILCSYGPTRDYLSLPLGQSSLALMDMVREEFRSHLRAVTHRAFRYEEESDVTTTLQDHNDRALRITARPLHRPEQVRGLVLITFERMPGAGAAALKGFSDSDLEQQLSEELDATRNELHSTIAALEASNEDLKGSNEEIMSMNEELQSTNEELETSREELQSLNEELSTVNTELEAKIDEVESANDDLGNLFSGTQVATVFLDRGMRIKRFTPAIRDLLNLIASDIGRPLRDMTLKFTDPDLLADADAVPDDLAPREREVQADDGDWYQRRILPYRTRDNVISGIVVTFANITDLKRATMLAQEREQRLNLAMSAIDGGMWDMNVDPRAPDELPDSIYLSGRLKRLLGFEDDQLPNSLHAWLDRILPEDRAAFSDADRRRQSDTIRPVHYRARHRDGGIRWFASYGKIVRDAHGRSTRWIGIDCDITDYKWAATQARHMQTQLRALADALPEMVAFVDSQRIIRFTNAAYNEWFDIEPGGLDGQMVVQALGEDDSTTLERCIDTALKGKAVSCRLQLDHHNLGQRTVQIKHLPHTVDGEVLGYYMLMTDTTSHKRRTTDQLEQQSSLVYIHRMATVGEMATTLAHDLNQPLSAITTYASGLTRMLHAGKPADETAPILKKIADQVQRASSIVGDVRDFVGRRETGFEEVDINALLHRSVSLMEGRARKMNVDTRLSIHTPLPAVYGDAVQIEQVLINLISNAFDAMEAIDRDERILWLTSETSGREHSQVVVTDSGEGIAAEKITTVFDSFHTTKLEGMGMGLSISRAIVESHGGQLWAESQAGHGATFYLKLPVAETTGKKAD